MSIEIKVPTLPESVTDATVSKWYKKAGENIERDENLVDLETDKVMLEVPAPASGVIEKIIVEEGTTVGEGEVLAVITEGKAEKPAEEAAAEKEKPSEKEEEKAKPVEKEEKAEASAAETELAELSPAVRRLVQDKGVDVNQIKGTGKGGRITKDDVEKYLAEQKEEKPKAAPTAAPSAEREEKRVPMSRLRARIAERLVQVQQEAAILTTFNEVNMKPVMDLRKRYKEDFEKKYGIRLGFMSFFTKAVIEALKRFPAVNASLDGNDMIYHNFYDIGIAVSSPRGLVVPIIRDADMLNMAEIEQQIKDYAIKAKEGKLAIEDMTGGTFTITNGGVFGSMLATPIINPPQTGILGMHNIVERPVVENGEIVIRPIMYIALSYDHRVIDGRESVTFLKTVKEMIEDPARLLLSI